MKGFHWIDFHETHNYYNVHIPRASNWTENILINMYKGRVQIIPRPEVSMKNIGPIFVNITRVLLTSGIDFY